MENLLNTDIRNIKGVGEKRAGQFEKLGLRSVGALLRFYPRGYEDWTAHIPVLSAQFGEKITFKARLKGAVSEHPIRRGMIIYKCYVVDEEGTHVLLNFFNNRFVREQLKPDTDYLFSGKLSCGYSGGREMSAPAFRPFEGNERLVPVYSQTEGISSRLIESYVARALTYLDDNAPDPLPEYLRGRYRLAPLKKALGMIHMPKNDEELREARRRLVFEELLQLQLGLMLLRGRSRRESSVQLESDLSDEFYSLLPFEPTAAQRRAVAECVADMRLFERPMARLVQGDVGSGKTVVAAALCYSLAKQGVQSALMTPTEILAQQHAQTLSKLFEGSGVRTELLTGSMSKSRKNKIYNMLEAGETDVLIGTHALISKGVRFSKLGLVITDEQHRFGVSQRAALSDKGDNPHLLVMSATPIPRTLALMIYGDLDLSVLDELPKGRLPILTYHVKSDMKERVYNFINKHVEAGEQAFIVCPAVEEGELDLAAATGYFERLGKNELAQCRLGLLHGRLKASDKESTMKKFVSGELDVLVSTTVVEVGVDVPNATVMLVENAERFGLSQLHQLRGRVGRGEKQAYCILISDSSGENATARMEAMVRTSDGFELSNLDLQLRGPGDFFGSRQHGLPNLSIADLSSDLRIFKTAQAEARAIIERDPQLEGTEFAAMRKQIELMFGEAYV